jgi:hypothetical protein
MDVAAERVVVAGKVRKRVLRGSTEKPVVAALRRLPLER